MPQFSSPLLFAADAAGASCKHDLQSRIVDAGYADLCPLLPHSNDSILAVMLDPVREVSRVINASDQSKTRIGPKMTRSDASSYQTSYNRLRQIFSAFGGVQNSRANESQGAKPDEGPEDEGGGRYFSQRRINSYSSRMYKHTKWQMENQEMRSLPKYTNAMHGFTPGQMKMHQIGSKSETSSPQAVLPSKARTEFGKVKIDDAPIPPSNSPLQDDQNDVVRGTKPRSQTDPICRACS